MASERHDFLLNIRANTSELQGAARKLDQFAQETRSAVRKMEGGATGEAGKKAAQQGREQAQQYVRAMEQTLANAHLDVSRLITSGRVDTSSARAMLDEINRLNRAYADLEKRAKRAGAEMQRSGDVSRLAQANRNVLRNIAENHSAEVRSKNMRTMEQAQGAVSAQLRAPQLPSWMAVGQTAAQQRASQARITSEANASAARVQRMLRDSEQDAEAKLRKERSEQLTRESGMSGKQRQELRERATRTNNLGWLGSNLGRDAGITNANDWFRGAAFGTERGARSQQARGAYATANPGLAERTSATDVERWRRGLSSSAAEMQNFSEKAKNAGLSIEGLAKQQVDDRYRLSNARETGQTIAAGKYGLDRVGALAQRAESSAQDALEKQLAKTAAFKGLTDQQQSNVRDQLFGQGAIAQERARLLAANRETTRFTENGRRLSIADEGEYRFLGLQPYKIGRDAQGRNIQAGASEWDEVFPMRQAAVRFHQAMQFAAVERERTEKQITDRIAATGESRVQAERAVMENQKAVREGRALYSDPQSHLARRTNEVIEANRADPTFGAKWQQLERDLQITPAAQGYQQMRQVEREAREARRVQESYNASQGSWAQQRMTEFRHGFRGNEEVPVMSQLGQTARFSTYYGGMYAVMTALSQGLQAVGRDFLQLEDALVDLQLVTGKSGEEVEHFADSVINAGKDVGMSSSQAASIAARSVGLYGLNPMGGGLNADADTIEKIVKTVGRTSFIAGPGADQGRILESYAGIQSAFGIDADQIGRLEDQMAKVSKLASIKAPDLLAGTAQMATLGSMAGSDPAQLASIVAVVSNARAQSPTASAGNLAQVLSRADDPAIAAKLAAYGIKTQGTTLMEQLAQVAQKNQSGELSDQELNRLTNTFGRGQSAAAVSAIIKDWAKLERFTTAARATAPGEGESQFAQQSSTIGFQIRALTTSLLQMGSAIANLGMLKPIGALLAALREVADMVTMLANSLKVVPGPIRDAGFALAELAAVTVLLSRITGTGIGMRAANALMGTGAAASAAAGGGVRGFLAGQAAGVRNAFAVPANLAAARQAGAAAHQAAMASANLAAANAAGAAGAMATPSRAARLGAGLAGASAGISSFVSTLVPLIIPIVIAAMAVGFIKGEMDKISKLSDSAAVAQGKNSRAVGSSELEEAYGRSRGVYKDTLDAQRGLRFWNKIPGSEVDRTQESTRSQMKFLEREAAKQKELEEAARDRAPVSWTSFDSVEATTTSLKTLAEGGASAERQIQLLNQSFDLLIQATRGGADAAMMLATQEDQLLVQRRLAASGAQLVGALQEDAAKREGYNDALPGARQKNLFEQIFGEDAARWVQVEPPDLRQGKKVEMDRRLRDALGRVDLNDLTTALDPAVARDMERAGIDASKGPAIITKKQQESLLKDVQKSYRDGLLAQLEAIDPGVTEKLDPATSKALDFRARKLAEGQIKQFAISDADPAAMLSYQQGIQQVAKAAGQNTEALSGGDALKGATAQKDVFAGMMAREKELADNVIKKYGMFSQQGFQALENLTTAQRDVMLAEQEFNKAQMTRMDTETEKKISGLGMDDATSRTQAALANAKAKMKFTTSPDDKNKLQAEINNLQNQLEQQQVEQVNATALSKIDPRNTKGRTQQELTNARRRLGALTPGSKEYADTVSQINELTVKLAEYANDYATATALLGVGMTDTVGQAAVKVADATRKLSFARAGGDPLAIAQAQQALREVQFEYRKEQVAVANSAEQASLRPGDDLAAATAAIHAAQRELQLADVGTKAYYDALKSLKEAQYNQLKEQVALANSRERSNVAPGDDLGEAISAINAAQREMQVAVAGSKQYYDALRSLREAQKQYATALGQYGHNLRLLSIDMTDPVAEANASVQEAEDALARAQSPFERAGAQVSLKKAQNQAEAAAFSQRIGDLKTNEELGRITHMQYLQYLQAEHNRLAAIANRTRQQQDQLDEVDKLMKAAADQASGQWNIGDIKLPTVYEVRRAMQGGAYGMAGQQTNYNSTITIVGADFGKVVKYITDATGGPTGMANAVVRRG